MLKGLLMTPCADNLERMGWICEDRLEILFGKY